MNNARQYLKQKIQKEEDKLKMLRELFAEEREEVDPPRIVASPPKKKVSPRRVNLETAATGFRKMPVVFTSREYRDQLRALTNVLITRAAGYRWLRKFEHEGECTQDKSVGNFQARVWRKTEAGKAMLRLSHDRAQPPPV
jgi:hypothetical protein